jgi:hypothetical protein
MHMDTGKKMKNAKNINKLKCLLENFLITFIRISFFIAYLLNYLAS